MARSLDQIISELDAGYNPSRQLINQKIDGLAGQADSEVAGLRATQEQAFGDITAGARDRGVGFSGIPIAEQAKYTASSFLPAVARVKQSVNDTRTSLLDSLNNVNLDQRKYATQLREGEMNRDEQTRQFNLQQQASERAARAASAASSVAMPSFGASLGGQQAAQAAQAQAAQPKVAPAEQQAFNSAMSFLNTKNAQTIKSDYAATLKSAQRGNQMDKIKIQLYQQARPDLFNGGVPLSAVVNNRVSY